MIKFPLQLSGLVPAWLWWLRMGASHPLYWWGGTIFDWPRKVCKFEEKISPPSGLKLIALTTDPSYHYYDLPIVFQDEYQRREINTRWVGDDHLILANCLAVFLSYFSFGICYETQIQRSNCTPGGLGPSTWSRLRTSQPKGRWLAGLRFHVRSPKWHHDLSKPFLTMKMTRQTTPGGPQTLTCIIGCSSDIPPVTSPLWWPTTNV